MDFIDEIRKLAVQIPKQKEIIRTEEGTKNAMIMPFIAALRNNRRSTEVREGSGTMPEQRVPCLRKLVPRKEPLE